MAAAREGPNTALPPAAPPPVPIELERPVLAPAAVASRRVNCVAAVKLPPQVPVAVEHQAGRKRNH